MKDVNIKRVFRHRSKYQLIELVRINGRRALFLDGELQYIEGEPLVKYHSHMAKGLDYVPYAKKVAIIGGGDGILAYFLLKKNPDLNIYLFELDKDMIKIFSSHPDAIAVNGNVFNYRNNVKVVIGDASKTLKHYKGFDAVFQDLPDIPSVGHELYIEMIDRAHDSLRGYGVFTMYGGGLVDPPGNFYEKFYLLYRKFIDIPEFELGANIFYGRKK